MKKFQEVNIELINLNTKIDQSIKEIILKRNQCNMFLELNNEIPIVFKAEDFLGVSIGNITSIIMDDEFGPTNLSFEITTLNEYRYEKLLYELSIEDKSVLLEAIEENNYKIKSTK